ncbi:lipase maturation factor 2a isoform X2 [Sardina pilchardus]|uniref:lipase maturation factor 2a isoform X2 n=1 Tax=Sardina pilchardus TaxID=27697 RepID=UPI002E153A15
MGEIRKAMEAFLWCMSTIYMFAFASLYIQIPGLYGNEGVLPSRWMLRYTGKGFWEQLRDSPTLLWLGPKLGLDTQQGMELIALLGTFLSLLSTLTHRLRDCRLYLCLWILYLSLYQVGQVFLYFQWDNLLLEIGFLCVLVAPLYLPWGRCRGCFHDNVTLWVVRWLLFRLMFASGVVKLTSRCPTWWGLTALTYHYETQCIPTPLAWFAHQLPVWWQKLSVAATFLIEIPVPFLFFSPIRRHRLTAFYLQVLLQVLIVLSGNYNFFNLLTVALCLSLLDDEHINFLLRRPSASVDAHKLQKSVLQKAWSWMCVCVEVTVYIMFIYWTILHFNLQIDWDKKEVSSKIAFTYHQFMALLKDVMRPSIWIGVLSLTWEIVKAMVKSACMRGVLLRFWSTLQWGVMAAAAASMFAISLVPFTFLDYDANNALWPGVKRAFEVTDRYQLTNSYGLFRRMTGVGGRPEVVIEGSWDRDTWTEIEFMYKPGNMSASPPFVTPHQPRLDWQMWFAALGPHHQSPWFTSLVHRLLQGKKDVIRLIQTDESNYPFKDRPPVFIRAHRYKYWFTEPKEDGTYPSRWWRRVYVEEFYPTVHLSDPFLESMLSQHGLKDKAPARRSPKATLPRMLAGVREAVCVLPAPLVVWSLLVAVVGACLLKPLLSRKHTRAHKASEREGRSAEPGNSHRPQAGHTPEKPTEQKEEEEEEEEEEEKEDRRGAGDGKDMMKREGEEEEEEEEEVEEGKREEGMEDGSDADEEQEEEVIGEEEEDGEEEQEETQPEEDTDPADSLRKRK